MTTEATRTTLKHVVESPLFDAILGHKKGQFATVSTVRECKVRKGKATIEKHSTFTIRVGVNYDNQAAVVEKRADGELPSENAGLPWGEWVDGYFPYLIEHKGTYYVRLTPVYGNEANKQTAKYFRDGVEITRDEAKADCLASEFPATPSENHAMTVKFDSITEVK